MEHVSRPRDVLQSIYDILKPGGNLYIGFSPIFKSPFGAHISYICKVPWVHLMFSEQTILRVLKKEYGISEKIASLQDIPGSGVNALSYFDYQEMISDFDWTIQIKRKNSFPSKAAIRWILNSLRFLMPTPSMKELFIVNAYQHMVKS
jgi:SAM-dependent methyltransferase